MHKYIPIILLFASCKDDISRELRSGEYSIRDEITWYYIVEGDTSTTTSVEIGTMILSDDVTTYYDTDTDNGEWGEHFTIQKNNQNDIEILGFAWVDLDINWSGWAYGTDTIYLDNMTMIYERTIDFEKIK